MVYKNFLQQSLDAVPDLLSIATPLEMTFEYGDLIEEPSPMTSAIELSTSSLECMAQPLLSVIIEDGTCVFRDLNYENQPQTAEVYIFNSHAAPQAYPVPLSSTSLTDLPEDLPLVYSVDSSGSIVTLSVHSTELIDMPSEHSADAESAGRYAEDLLLDLIGESEEAELYFVEHSSPDGTRARSLFSRSRAPETKKFVFDFHGIQEFQTETQ